MTRTVITSTLAAWCALVAGAHVAAAEFGATGGTGASPALSVTLDGLPDHTVYLPQRLPDTPMPLFVWGNGGCSSNGLAHAAYLREIASHGYLVIALGSPRVTATPPPQTGTDPTQPAQMIEAMDWATRENSRPASLLHARVDLSRIAAGGHSCGGLQAMAVSHDPRIDTTLVLNSGIYIRPGGRSGVQIDKSQLLRLHGPMLYLSGGPTDVAHPNASDDVQRIAHLPVFFGALEVGHGGTFNQPDGGEWARVSTRWLNWQLRGDADAEQDFAGQDCRLCRDDRWAVVQKNLPVR